MDADDVQVSVLYPTVPGAGGQEFTRVSDRDLEVDCVRAYNDWLGDEWGRASDRFVPQCLVPLGSVEATVAEIRRAVRIGHRGVLLPAIPTDFRDLPHINDPSWDPMWATCQELEVPICFHAGTSDRIQLAPHASYSGPLADALRAMTAPVSTAFVLVNFLLSRILLRHPRLQVVFAESGIAWAAYLLEYADHQFEKDRLFTQGYDLKPSDMFRRQCYLTACYEFASLDTRAFIGVDNILWATNFPLATSPWPNTREFLARWESRVPEEDRRKMLWSNAAGLYHIDVGRLGAPPAQRVGSPAPDS